MIRWIVMETLEYENMWPPSGEGQDSNEPMSSFSTREEAEEYAKHIGLISSKGRRNNAEILSVRVPDA